MRNLTEISPLVLHIFLNLLPCKQQTSLFTQGPPRVIPTESHHDHAHTGYPAEAVLLVSGHSSPAAPCLHSAGPQGG